VTGRALRRALLIVALPVIAVIAAGTRAEAGGEPPTSDVVVTGACDRDAPGDWLVIDEASGAGDGNLLCNYRTGDDGGVAITINWYCSAAEAAATWSAVTSGDRPTRTLSTDTEQRILEGPLAPNPDNPHRDGVTSMFFPDQVFTWFEKSWIRANEQVIITAVAISGAAPMVPGDGESWTAVPRRDIEEVDSAALALAAAQIPELATCAIPPITSPGGSGTPAGGAGGGRGHDHPLVVIAAGGAAVVIGGVTIATRRKRRPVRQVPGSSTATSVPPRCAELDQRYTTARDQVLTMMDAESSLHEMVDKALAVQRRNVATANLALGFDAGRLIGGALAAVPLSQPGIALRGTSPGRARPQYDTWRPPANLPAALTAPFTAVAHAATTASARVASLQRKLAAAAAHPSIRLVRDRLAASSSKLASARSDLTGSQFARRDLGRVAEQIGRHHDEIARGARRIAELEHNLEQLRTWASHPRMGPAIRQNMRRTLDLVREARANVTAAQQALPELVAQRRSLTSDLAQFGNMQHADVQRMAEAHQALARDLAATEAGVRSTLERQLATAVGEEQLAAGALKSAMEQAARAAAEQDSFGRATLRGATSLLGTLGSPVLVPMAWLAEHTFGRSQTPQEILEILQRDAARTVELSTAQHVLERTLRQRRSSLELLHHQLAQCVSTTVKEGVSR
jgi:hypothetical protein